MAVFLLAVLVAACGVGPQDEPESLDLHVGDRTLPVDSTPPDGVPHIEFASTIYLISGDGTLVPVTRDLVAPVGADEQLRALFTSLAAGPTDLEVAQGLRSAIPPTTDVLGTRLDDGTLTVDLSSSFASIGGPSELRAVGQIVLTGTTFPGARELLLRLDGEATAIPLPDGALTDEPVTLRQFSALLATEPDADPG